MLKRLCKRIFGRKNNTSEKDLDENTVITEDEVVIKVSPPIPIEDPVELTPDYSGLSNLKLIIYYSQGISQNLSVSESRAYGAKYDLEHILPVEMKNDFSLERGGMLFVLSDHPGDKMVSKSVYFPLEKSLTDTLIGMYEEFLRF